MNDTSFFTFLVGIMMLILLVIGLVVVVIIDFFIIHVMASKGIKCEYNVYVSTINRFLNQ